MDFERLDINQCPKGEGNKGPNHFADTARCKKETTECEPLHGWGFRRGGYQCRCKPGYRLPNVVRRPYLGEIIERASAEQYYNDYDCLKIGCKYILGDFYGRINYISYFHIGIQKTPIEWEKAPYHVREKYLDQRPEYRNYSTGAAALHSENLNVDQALKFIHGVNYRTCKK